MSGQVSHGFHFNDRKYDVIMGEDALPFHPDDLDLKPTMACTACWAGWWGDFEIEKNQLILNTLYINTVDGQYPKVNGRKADRKTVMGHHCYKKLNQPVPYTGMILIGDEFMQDYYIHMGTQRYWAYKKLLVLEFEDGRFISSTDVSDVGVEARKIVSEGRSIMRERVDGTFSQLFSHHDPKALWWI